MTRKRSFVFGPLFLFALIVAASLVIGVACRDGTDSVRGIVIDVKSVSLLETESITVRTKEGKELTFSLGPEVDVRAFSPSHLRQHMLGGVPVTVYYKQEKGGRLVATRITD